MRHDGLPHRIPPHIRGGANRATAQALRQQIMRSGSVAPVDAPHRPSLQRPDLHIIDEHFLAVLPADAKNEAGFLDAKIFRGRAQRFRAVDRRHDHVTQPFQQQGEPLALRKLRRRLRVSPDRRWNPILLSKNATQTNRRTSTNR